MDDVELTAHAEVSAQCAGSSLATVGDTGHLAEHAYHIHSLQTHHYYRRGSHRFDYRREERLVYKMSVVLAKYSLVKLHHLHSTDYQSSLLNSSYHLPYEIALDAGRLQYYQCLLHLSLNIF